MGYSSTDKSSAKTPRFYYGWIIVGIIFLSRFAGTTMQNPTVSVLIKPITNDFGWSRSLFVSASSVGTILGGLLALIIGPAIDRYGPRWIITFGFLVMGALMILMGSINNLWQFYLLLVLSRMILQGALNLTSNVSVAKWFYRRRGIALAFPAIGQRVGAGSTPLLAQYLTSSAGWRSSLIGLGLLAWGLTVIPAGIWLRRKPEDLGLLPEGDLREVESGADTEVTQEGINTEVSFSLNQALRTKVFYLLLFVVSLSTFTNAGANFNIFPILTDRGISGFNSVILLSAWSYIGIPSTLFWGYLGDRYKVRYLFALVLLGMSLGTVLFLVADDLVLGLIFAFVHGFFFAGSLLFQNLIFANYFGRESFGAIRGVVTPFQTFSNAMGPLAASLVFDATGSYDQILIAWILLLPLLAIAVALAKPAYL